MLFCFFVCLFGFLDRSKGISQQELGIELLDFLIEAHLTVELRPLVLFRIDFSFDIEFVIIINV